MDLRDPTCPTQDQKVEQEVKTVDGVKEGLQGEKKEEFKHVNEG